jgi:16S rRNA (guanine1207-N2)-methyltransferase
MSESQYFDPSPNVASSRREVAVVLPDLAFTIETDRGVFSHGALDAGTKLLLQEAPSPPATGNVLDLGCGAGPIAITLARRAPGAHVWAVDVNERALELCRENALRNGVTNVSVVTPPEVPDDVRFDLIWSNPPIRIGKQALHDLLLFWFDRLVPDGRAVMVVGKNLGGDSLQAWLTAQGYPTTRLASAKGFRVLESRREGSSFRSS